MTQNLHLAAIALATVAFAFIWEGHVGFSLEDEGFLWYGVQRVMLGEVPKLDFKAYDPGRYYWAALLMGLWQNNGIMALRGSVALFQTLGLFVGLKLIAGGSKKPNIAYISLAAITLVIWMLPRHKLFDISLCIFLIGVLASLIHHPVRSRYVLTGVCVGLVAVFGRNHGLYGVVGSVAAMFWLAIGRQRQLSSFQGFIFWAGGVLLGYLPIFLMLLLIPGYAEAFFEGLLHQLERGSTNLPLPLPWPWRVDFEALPTMDALHGVAVGLFFIAVSAFAALAFCWIFWQQFRQKRMPPALVAACCLAPPYAHYAFSRADVPHLAQGIFPMLLGSLLLFNTLGGKRKWLLAMLFCIAGLWVTSDFHPAWQCRQQGVCTELEISGSTLLIRSGTASDIAFLRQLVGQYAPNGESFLVTPYWPGAYALFQSKSPMWEIYALFPHQAVFENAEIERIKAASPVFALVLDLPLDGLEGRRFKITHPLTYQFIMDNFDPLLSPYPAYQIFRARKTSQ